MTLSELYKALEMDGPEDLDYFEQFADLMEMDGDIPFDLFYMALSGLKPDTAGDLVENYFEDLTGAAPDEENDLVSIIDSVEQNLLLLAAAILFCFPVVPKLKALAEGKPGLQTAFRIGGTAAVFVLFVAAMGFEGAETEGYGQYRI